MLQSLPNEWGLIIESVADGTRPAAAWGTSITPGNNTYGSYVQVLTATSDETYLCRVTLASFFTSAQARDALVTIGIDPAGGTSYTDLIPDLMASCAPNYYSALPSPTIYEFPIRIPAGATVGAKASVNNGTVGTGRVAVTLFGRPSRPELVKAGTFVQAFGVTAASSSGTAITPGTTSEGAWTQLGSALTVPLWWWEWGVGINNATMTNNNHHVDIGIGDAGNKKIVVPNGIAGETSSETISKLTIGRAGVGAVGDIVYARIQTGPNAATANMSVMAYGVG